MSPDWVDLGWDGVLVAKRRTRQGDRPGARKFEASALPRLSGRSSVSVFGRLNLVFCWLPRVSVADVNSQPQRPQARALSPLDTVIEVAILVGGGLLDGGIAFAM